MKTGEITIRYLQQYLKAKDPAQDANAYFLKMIEEVGELAEALRKRQGPASAETFKGSPEEEIWDVIYYALTVANALDIDLERWIPYKEELNRLKYGHTVPFDP
jgi:NTP pyrophosphatase (non-canonical NTP hydrolase)